MVTCKELGCPNSKDESMVKANSWWRARLAAINPPAPASEGPVDQILRQIEHAVTQAGRELKDSNRRSIKNLKLGQSEEKAAAAKRDLDDLIDECRRISARFPASALALHPSDSPRFLETYGPMTKDQWGYFSQLFKMLVSEDLVTGSGHYRWFVDVTLQMFQCVLDSNLEMPTWPPGDLGKAVMDRMNLEPPTTAYLSDDEADRSEWI